MKDRRANNYLSQVAAVIVGGWRMIEEGSVCVCVCVFVPQQHVLLTLQRCRRTERRFCVPRQEVCFHLSGLSQLHPWTRSGRDKGERSRMSDWDQAGEASSWGGRGEERVFGKVRENKLS